LYNQPTENQSISSSSIADENATKLIEPYTEGMAKAMNEVIGFCPSFWEKKKPKSTIGSFMVEATYQAASEVTEKPIDFCLLNYGGIRITLDSGDITVGEVFQIMPFENEITILTLSKSQMDSLYVIIERKGGEPFINHQWKDRTAYHVMNQTQFRVATNDYMANGGDNYSILTEAIEREDTGIKIRDGLITYIKTHNPLPTEYKDSKN
jgi:2',3'-cyclic-nucleotide 2'-phosphodiesterase (5'-nucleotidase family)